MAEREERNLSATRLKIAVIADVDRLGTLLRGARDCALDLIVVSGLEHD